MKFILALLVVTLAASAQLAELSGLVRDASGSSIPGAALKLTSTAQNTIRSAETNEAGLYSIPAVAPGTYRLEVSAKGFRAQVRADLLLQVNAKLQVDFRLEVGDVAESVTVSADYGEVRAADSAVSYTVSAEEVSRLPAGGSRNYTRLVLLIPGSSSISRSQNNGTISGTALYSVNGQRPQDNNYTLDGIENNLFHKNSPGGSPPLDSIQEFRVMTNSPAEFGRSVGANVSVVTKSGTNELHGSLYEFFRNDKLDANEFFANRQGIGKVPFRQNNFGAAVGGPLILPKVYNGKQKSFWFTSYEGFRRRRGSTIIATFPTAQQRSGNFDGTGRNIYDPMTSRADAQGRIVRDLFAGNRVPQGRINRASTYWLEKFAPLPNRGGLTLNYVNPLSQRNDRDNVVARFDHYFSQRDSVMVRYLDQQAEQATPTSNPQLFSRSSFNVRNLAARWSRVLSPVSVLDVSFGYHIPIAVDVTKNNFGLERDQFLTESGMRLFNAGTPYNPVPAINVRGEYAISEGGGAVRDDVFQFIANYSRQMGRHSLKTGANISRRMYTKDAANPMNGIALFDTRLTNLSSDSLSGSGTASLLLGFPSEVTRGEGLAQLDGRQTAWQGFVQDEWRVGPRLTLTFGVRYEFQKPVYDVYDRLGTILVERDANTGKFSGSLLWAGPNALTGQGPNRRHYGRGLQVTDPNNFAPRVSLVTQLPGAIILRSGFGIFFNSTFMQEAQDKNKFYPYSTSQFFTANTGVLPNLALTDVGPAYGNTEAIGGWPQNPDNRTPYSQQWNFSLERMLPQSVLFRAAYVGAANRKQIGYSPFNTAPIPGPGPVQPRRLLPQFGDIQLGNNEYNSNYNALQLTAYRRFANGLQFNANYTWGRSMDDQSSLAETRTQNPFNRRADYSRSSFDVRHVFQTSFLFEVPYGRGLRFGGGLAPWTNALLGGWSLEGIFRFQSGAAVNAVSGVDRANVGQSTQRPNVSRDPNNGPKTPDQWFDTAAFTPAAQFSFGNAGAYILNADGRRAVDLSLFKKFAFGERHALSFRAEMYNMPNLVSFGDPNANLNSTAFGRVTSATDPRQIQLVLRYSF